MGINLLTFVKARGYSWIVGYTPHLYTIGYEGLTIDSFIEKLLRQKIRVLIDVRNNPISRKPGFSKSAFRNYLESAGISYQHIPQLGVPSALRKNLNSIESYQSLFRYYEKEILRTNLDCLDRIMMTTTQFGKVALTCFEADHLSCHRHVITEYLSQISSFEAKIVHLN